MAGDRRPYTSRAPEAIPLIRKPVPHTHAARAASRHLEEASVKSAALRRGRSGSGFVQAVSSDKQIWH